MLFTSIYFYIFLVAVFSLYWFMNFNKVRIQNILLLVASYTFYGLWSWRYLVMLVGLSLVNYLTGVLLQRTASLKKRRLFLFLAITMDIGVLGYFKYYNFFVNEFVEFLHFIGVSVHIENLRLILPVGISFYTFLLISYLLDINRKKIEASVNLFDALLSFSFFPIILAGPIQRPQMLLQQLQQKREFDYAMAVEGLRRILWGLFMKIVIADNLAAIVNETFTKYQTCTGSSLFIGAVFFAIQIYADFAGYSEIAIGSAKLLGINLVRNFAYPYFATDIAEFWRRWHMSLTSWFRDYLFLPIAYTISRIIKSERFFYIKSDLVIYMVSITLTWFITGLWHGANFTFLAWGLIHGFFLILHQISKKPKKKLLHFLQLKKSNFVLIGIGRIYLLIIVLTAWIFFRSDSLHMAFSYLNHMLSYSLFTLPKNVPLFTLSIVIAFSIAEYLQRKKQFTLQIEHLRIPRFVQWSIYYLILAAIIFLGGHYQSFIYMQY